MTSQVEFRLYSRNPIKENSIPFESPRILEYDPLLIKSDRKAHDEKVREASMKLTKCRLVYECIPPNTNTYIKSEILNKEKGNISRCESFVKLELRTSSLFIGLIFVHHVCATHCAYHSKNHIQICV